MKKLLILFMLMLLVFACQKGEGVIPEKVFAGFIKPAHFDEPLYDFSRNSFNEAIFELGKRLFYEPRLSRNNTISCGSCHIQSAGFTHHGHDVSHGIDDRLGTRNPMPIFNLAWRKEFFWDGGVFDLDLSPVAAITSPVEMDETVPNVISKLRDHPEYPLLFKKAFGTEEITDARFFKALSQFMLMAVSSNAKYDKVKAGKESFTTQEQAGYIVYQRSCASCHAEPLFTNGHFLNNGLAPNAVNDKGRFLVTLNPEDNYKFLVPSLRNLEFTAPYMHDGRFLTLNRVIEHYRKGIVLSETTDARLIKNDGTAGIDLTEKEKDELLIFLKTLTDYEFVKNPLLAEPVLY